MGDQQAMESLYRENHGMLLGLARRMIPDGDAARDVEHDAWVMILTSLSTLRDASCLKSWMCNILRNTALNYLKHNRMIQTVSIDAVDEIDEISDVETAASVVPMADMMAMVDRLPDGYERLFRLNTFEGMNHSQIGELLGISAGASRVKLLRARSMLRDMIRQYWALLLVGVLATVGVVMYKYNRKPVMLPTEVEHGGQVAQSRVVDTIESVPHESCSVDGRSQGSLARRITASSVPESENVVVASLDSVAAPVLPAWATLPGSRSAAEPNSVPMVVLPPQNIAVTWPSANWWSPEPLKRHRQPVTMHLAYGGAPGGTSTVVDNFLSVINYAAGSHQRSMKLYTWKEYSDYVNAYSNSMDSLDAQRMSFIADRTTGEPSTEPTGSVNDEPLSETKHHERPHTVRLSLSWPLNQRWSVNSGVGYTWMKSVFEADNGNGNDITRRTQRLSYVDVPLGATYTIWQRNRLSLYASGNVQLGIPVHGSETTDFVYIGPFEHAAGDSIVFPSTHAHVQAPWQWSVGASVGAQYNVMPHVSVYFEPGFRYYIPTGSPVETYRTVHPFDVALPFGIRFTP